MSSQNESHPDRKYTGGHETPPKEVPNFVPWATFEHGSGGHEQWRVARSRYHSKRLTVSVHRLLAVAEYGVDAVADKQVHHKNGIPWDNRIENLELLDQAEHSRLHHRGKEVVSDEELLEDLTIGATVLGFPPRPVDIREFGEYSYPTYIDRFGSWDAAIEEAGLDPYEIPGLHGEDAP